MQVASINFMPPDIHFSLISQSCQEINEKKHLKGIGLFLVYFTVRENDQHHPRESRQGKKTFTTCHSGNRPVADASRRPVLHGEFTGTTTASAIRLRVLKQHPHPHRMQSLEQDRSPYACVVERAYVMESTVEINAFIINTFNSIKGLA